MIFKVMPGTIENYDDVMQQNMQMQTFYKNGQLQNKSGSSTFYFKQGSLNSSFQQKELAKMKNQVVNSYQNITFEPIPTHSIDSKLPKIGGSAQQQNGVEQSSSHHSRVIKMSLPFVNQTATFNNLQSSKGFSQKSNTNVFHQKRSLSQDSSHVTLMNPNIEDVDGDAF